MKFIRIIFQSIMYSWFFCINLLVFVILANLFYREGIKFVGTGIYYIMYFYCYFFMVVLFIPMIKHLFSRIKQIKNSKSL